MVPPPRIERGTSRATICAGDLEIKDLAARFPKLRMLGLSTHDEALYAERALRAGAKGYDALRRSALGAAHRRA